MTSRRQFFAAGLTVASAGLATGVSARENSAEVQELAAIRARINGAQGFPPSFNPMAGNPLRSRADVVRAVKDLYLPLAPYYSPGGARVRLDMATASFDRTAADMEGFARPLWGLAPLAAGGGADFVDWDLIRRGLANGMDPEHPEFWGAPGDRDQRLVELAAVGYALALIPDTLFTRQPPRAQANIRAYLQAALGRTFADNNWMFFRFMIAFGLSKIGGTVDPALLAEYRSRIDAFYLGDGWYRDGAAKRADHYVGFAMHYYGLVYSRLGDDAQWGAELVERARAFAPQFQRWFAEDGAVVPFGRSLSYRFACAGFWSAMAFAGVDAAPVGVAKGLLLRHLRWWSRQPMTHRDGVLSIGYAYPDLHMCETYNSACSPFWSFKAFAALALPETDPFWTAQETALPLAPDAHTQSVPGMILYSPLGDAVALSSGQEGATTWMRAGAEKYAKFAYSARYGFSVEINAGAFPTSTFDSMLAFSFDEVRFHVREANVEARVADECLYSRWTAGEHVDVETWLLPASPWHVRVHRIVARRACKSVEGGFAAARGEGPAKGEAATGPGAGLFTTPTDLTGVLDGGSSIARTGRVIPVLPNANLINAVASVPQLLGDVPVGETMLVTRVLAMPAGGAARDAWASPPDAPSLAELIDLIAGRGAPVRVAVLP